jgi:hypothetical protein
MKNKLIAAAAITLMSVAGSSAVLAGEVTGGPNPKSTGMEGHARSVCAFSGLEETPAFQDSDENVKPGRLTQTPHYQMTGGGPVFHAPGMPGEACNPSGD